METGTFLHKNVMAYIEKYCVPLKYSSGRDADQIARFNILTMPSCVVLNAEGDELGRRKGFMNAVEIVEFLEEIRKGREAS